MHLSVNIYIDRRCLSFFLKLIGSQNMPTKTKPISKQLARRKRQSSRFVSHRQINHDALRQALAIESTDCLICCCPLVQPVALECGHFCCLQCLEEGSLQSGRCSFCKERISIKEILINKSMQRFVRHSLNLLGPHHRENYNSHKRVIESKEKIRLVNASQLRIGDDIDYRDSKRMTWLKGSIMEIEQSNDHKLIYVQFTCREEEGQDFDIFQSYSRNIAPAGYFTNRINCSRNGTQSATYRVPRFHRIKFSPHYNRLHQLLNAS